MSNNQHPEQMPIPADLEKQITDLLCKEIEGGLYGINNDRFEKISAAARAVVSHLSQTKAAPVHPWVSVNDALPELTEPFMMYNDDGVREVAWEKDHCIVLGYNPEIGAFKAKRDKRGWSEISTNSINGTITPTHWMLFPKSPTEEITVPEAAPSSMGEDACSLCHVPKDIHGTACGWQFAKFTIDNDGLITTEGHPLKGKRFDAPNPPTDSTDNLKNK